MAIGTTCDPIYLEVFNNLFMSIAEQMGFTLQNTAFSVNMKERLDFSCAIFNPTGQLIANAPHMPVSQSLLTIPHFTLLSSRRPHAPGFIAKTPYTVDDCSRARVARAQECHNTLSPRTLNPRRTVGQDEHARVREAVGKLETRARKSQLSPSAFWLVHVLSQTRHVGSITRPGG